jgi:hypothetical protein
MPSCTRSFIDRPWPWYFRATEAEIAVDEPILRREVPALDPLRQLDLLVGLEQAEATGFAQELLKGLQKDLVRLKQLGRGGDAVQYVPLLGIPTLVVGFYCTTVVGATIRLVVGPLLCH